MSMIYLVVLVGVGIALLVATMEAVRSVSRRPQWDEPKFFNASLREVETVDRRHLQLPFVGTERRTPSDAGAPSDASVKNAA